MLPAWSRPIVPCRRWRAGSGLSKTGHIDEMPMPGLEQRYIQRFDTVMNAEPTPTAVGGQPGAEAGELRVARVTHQQVDRLVGAEGRRSKLKLPISSVNPTERRTA
ncbi:hypothetical protein [Actinoplanes sp. ATCC 53533]|uniref:hypothetical protein n=1 Tax=Actinoplanes sp. ATCC 53533 TaxID=1288362 RepID=UPI000F76C0E3|nr:hypothetical protein [Actinoplanes sp. ATCC 53533]